MEQMYNETGKKYDLQRYTHHLHWAAGCKGKSGDPNSKLDTESSEEEDIQAEADNTQKPEENNNFMKFNPFLFNIKKTMDD